MKKTIKITLIAISCFAALFGLVTILGKYNAIISNEPSEQEVTDETEVVSFLAKVLEVNETYLLVEPYADSSESMCSDKIEIPLENKTSWPIPMVGEIVNVFYSGLIQETYPAHISNVHRVEILEMLSIKEYNEKYSN